MNMKKIAAVLLILSGMHAQVHAQIATNDTRRQITVAGEGKIKVTPDEVMINIGVENRGDNAAQVKQQNDITVDKVIKYLKKINLPEKDYQTKRVYLNRSYDYKRKVNTYIASQTLSITLRDLSKYDDVIVGLTEAGINNIEGIHFKTSKQEQYEKEARKKAVADAREKAKDYADALELYLGYAIIVNDNSVRTNYRMPMYVMEEVQMMDSSRSSGETLAPGEIEVTASITVTYELAYYDIKARIDGYKKARE